MSKKILSERINFYSNFKKNPNLIANNEILYKFSITDKELSDIKISIKELILNNLKIYFKKKILVKSSEKNYLYKYKKHIIKLPNITPGGLIQPRKEIAQYYNKVHKKLITILKSKKIIKEFQSCSRINIRFKDGVKINKFRKYSTFKPHSDSWNGHTVSSIFMLGIEGDVSNNTVQYFKPIKFKNSFLETMKSFNQGKKTYQGKKYLGKLEKNQIVILDQLCLHKTDILNLNPRISIDFAINLKKAFKSKMIFKKNINKYRYSKLKNWVKINHLKLPEAKISLFDKIT